MTTEDFIIELFIRIDDAMKGIEKDCQANLFPSEIVTLGIWECQISWANKIHDVSGIMRKALLMKLPAIEGIHK